jgi:hypothetical protein
MNLQTFFSTPGNWCQHSLRNHRGQSCLMGALIRVYGNHTEAMINAKRALLQLLNFWSIEAWNDMDGRTEADVQELVKKANV